MAMISDNTVLAGLMYADRDKYRLLDKNFTQEPYAIGIKKGQTKFTEAVNQALKEIREDGTYNRLMKKWFTGISGFSIEEATKTKLD